MFPNVYLSVEAQAPCDRRRKSRCSDVSANVRQSHAACELPPGLQLALCSEVAVVLFLNFQPGVAELADALDSKAKFAALQTKGLSQKRGT